MSQATDAEIIARWDAGETMTRIAEYYGLSRERVRQRLERNGRGGPNRNALPSAAKIFQIAAEATSMPEIAATFEISDTRLRIALEKHGIRKQVDELLQTNRQTRANQRRLQTQNELIVKIRGLAAQVQHTPTSRDLETIGLFAMTLHHAFGSVPTAMIAAGLEPNVTGRPPKSLPTEFSILAVTQDIDSLYEQARRIQQFGLTYPAAGNEKPERAEYLTRAFYRDPSVVAWILENADGVCEACGEPGYETDDGTRFLEVHHVIPLSDGGPDFISNTVAVCETCHGKLHHWKHRAFYQRQLYERISRLKG